MPRRGGSRRSGPAASGGPDPADGAGGAAQALRGAPAGPSAVAAARAAVRRTLVISLRGVRLVLGPVGRPR